MVTYSIIQKSQLEGALRLDAEFYCAESVFNHPFELGGKIVEFVQYGTSEDLNENHKGFPVLRLNEFEDYFIKKPEKHCNKISQAIFESLRLKKGDVLICRTNGNPKLVGKSALVMEDTDYVFASYLFRVRPNKQKINAPTLVAFLNSKFGRGEIEKYLMPSIQSNFSPAQFREIKIPIFPENVRISIDKLFKNSYQQINISKGTYIEAENLLLEELGLSDYREDEKLFSVVNLSEIKAVERMDAEYFQPKYGRLESGIKNHESNKLGDLVILKKGFEPGSEAYQDEGKLFIRVSSLSKYGIENQGQKYLSEDLYQKLKKDYEPKGGEILLTKDATPGIAYVVKEKIEGIISGGILRLKLKENIEPEYLALCLNSVVGQMQAERDAGGSIIAHWKPEQIKNLLVPILPQSIQKKIADLVGQSHEARKKAKQLLEEAKQKVEELIEKGK